MVIQKMRDGSEGILAKVIIGLIIIVFSLFGFGSITTFLAPVPKVATVNGEDVTQQEMEVAVERNRRLLVARGVPMDEINEDELRQNVLDSLVARELLAQAADEFNLRYSDAEIDADIVATEIFQVDGVFNPVQFQNVIRGAGYTPLMYREEVRTDKLFDQLLTGIRGSAFVTAEESERYTSLLSQTRDIAYIEISAASLVDEVEVTEADIQTYYEENTQEFVTEETVDLEFVELRHADLAAMLEVDEAELAAFFESIQSDYSIDESRRVAHILIETSDALSSEDAKAKAEAIYERIKEGEDFSSLAQENSDDVGSKSNGGDLGFNPAGTFYPEFEAVAFDLALNQVAPPVETEIGFHVIKVLEIQDAVTPTLEDVRAEVEQTYKLSATEEDFVADSALLAELLFESIDLEAPAAELGVSVQTTGHLTREASHFLMANNRVKDAVFSPDVLLDGNNSDLIELAEDHHVGVRVREHNPSITRPLADVTMDIRYILQREQAAELAKVRADEIVEAVESGSLAQFVADQYNLQWQLVPSASRFTSEANPLVLREAFKLPRPADARESLGTSVLPNGDALVMRVSSVVNKPVSELATTELAGLRDNLAAQMGLVDFQEFENTLRVKADIETL